MHRRTDDDDDSKNSKFFKALQPTKPIAFRKVDVEADKAKARLERNQSEAKILANLSHVRKDPPLPLLFARFWEDIAKCHNYPESLSVRKHDVSP